jgi:hypothetical protein
VVIQYTFASSYFWMLCQGIYLHTLIIVAVFVGEQREEAVAVLLRDPPP